MKHNPINPKNMIDIPNVERNEADILSDNLPEANDTTAIMMDCTMSIKPASRGDNPLTYWRYKLNIKEMAKVAE